MDLIEGFISGDHDTFESIVNLYRKDAESFAKRLLLNAHTAEDIVQDAFVTLYVQREKYKRKYALKTYLYTIIRNKCVDHIRKQSRILLGDSLEVIDERTPETSIIRQETILAVQDAITQLKKPYQVAIHLVDYDELSYKEASKIMDMSLSAFKVTLLRGRRQLKIQLEGVI